MRASREAKTVLSGSMVLCYHAVSDEFPAEMSVRPDRLAQQVRTLLKRGYQPVRFSELVAASPRERIFAVTFDDAFRSVAVLAAPILGRLGVPGTLFVPTEWIETQRPLGWAGVDHWLVGPHAHEMVPATWDEIRELHAAGWEIGSHSASHPLLTRVTDDVLHRELHDSRALCEERLQAPCLSIAYPYGNVDDRVARAAGDAGYQAAAGLPGRFGTRDALQWPRIGVYQVDDQRRFRLKTSVGVTRLRGSGLWATLERLRGHGEDAAGAADLVASTAGRVPAVAGRQR